MLQFGTTLKSHCRSSVPVRAGQRCYKASEFNSKFISLTPPRGLTQRTFPSTLTTQLPQRRRWHQDRLPEADLGVGWITSQVTSRTSPLVLGKHWLPQDAAASTMNPDGIGRERNVWGSLA